MRVVGIPRYISIFTPYFFTCERQAQVPYRRSSPSEWRKKKYITSKSEMVVVPRPPQDDNLPASSSSPTIEETWLNADGVNVFEASELKTQHSLIKLRIGRHRIRLKAMVGSDLSPLDMDYKQSSKTTYNTNNELSDGTGHMVWLASMAFMHLLEEGGDGEASLLADLFDSKMVLELGCGTGAASICISRLCHPQKIVMTDNDPEAIKLAKENCKLNNVRDDLVEVDYLEWENNNPKTQSFDTVFATDVLYDLKMIAPLLKSAHGHLKLDGNLCLSHVPRFCIPDSAGLNDGMNPLERLEKHIVDQSAEHGFKLDETIRPNQVLLELPEKAKSPTEVSLETLEQAHAVVFIFSKVS
jgi:2-polyprenyl-3-methyl-5-hydroxy-6-metoxy-1,4-benzoquinol methylase